MPGIAQKPFALLTSRPNLAVRAVALALLLFCEKYLLNQFVDFDAAQHASGLGIAVRISQHWGFRFLVSLGISLALFSYVRGDERFAVVNRQARQARFCWPWMLAHVLLFLPLIPLSYSLYGDHGLKLPFGDIVALWLLFALTAVLAASAAVAPWSLWRQACRTIGVLWLYAGGAAFIGASAMQLSERLWEPTARLTFNLVQHMLAPIVPTLTTDPATLVLSTDRFAVQVAEVCSGLEGLGLMLAFCGAWLLFFRREYIFPRALLLIPAALALMFFLNSLRIAGLLLIGHAGYPEVAQFGFHSQAGWIAFNVAACGIVILSRRSRWLSHSETVAIATRGDNPTAAYLVPFLTIIAAGMLAHAASGSFEFLYPLRPIAAALALWAFRGRLRALDWSFTWRGPAAGLVVAALWFIAVHYTVAKSGMPRSLADFQWLPRAGWITARLVAAVVTVPIAEELAFRGYLLRRLQGPDFESYRFEAVGWLPLLASALIFGLAHGALWLPGLVAGSVFGWLVKRTGRFGEAVAAHVTANAVLAGCVLFGNQWQLW
jgi:exosortase E/protease (VPEID-CTERM system)